MRRPMIALLLGAPPIALVVSWAAGPGPFGLSPSIVAGISLGAAVAIGTPLLFFATERDLDGLVALTVLGIIGGALAPLLLLFSGIVGVYLQSNVESARFALAHGASIPGYGQLAWPRFLWLVARAVIVGAVTGALCAIFRRRSVRRAARR